jgi:hypothetical protein
VLWVTQTETFPARKGTKKAHTKKSIKEEFSNFTAQVPHPHGRRGAIAPNHPSHSNKPSTCDTCAPKSPTSRRGCCCVVPFRRSPRASCGRCAWLTLAALGWSDPCRAKPAHAPPGAGTVPSHRPNARHQLWGGLGRGLGQPRQISPHRPVRSHPCTGGLRARLSERRR